MSNNHDYAPLRTAPELNGRQSARVGVSLAAKEIADYAAALVPTGDDPHTAPGDFIARARQIRIMGLELLHRAVTEERMRGTPWNIIADQLGLTPEQAEHQFSHCDLNHLADECGRTGVWAVLAETCVCPAPLLCDPDPGTTALQLDDWYRGYATGQPGDPAAITKPQPVTAGL